MNLLFQFKEYIQSNNLFQLKDKLLLAVSGGVDSVALCELCKQTGFDFAIAHCNFQLRGEESTRDEEFVKTLGKKYAVEVFIKKFETEKYSVENKVSIQVAARELRYAWFAELIGNMQLAAGKGVTSIAGTHCPLPIAHYLLTAHHLGDNIETMLMNFFKGTGIAGLRGILPRQGKVIRPLLFAKKEELMDFVKAHHLQWVEDSSNESHKYSRNYVRHQVLPLIETIYPEVENNLAENLRRFRDVEVLYRQSIALHKQKLCEQKGNEIHLPVLKLKKNDAFPTIIFEIIKEYNFHAAQVDEVIALLDSESGKYVASSTHRVIRNRNWLIISPVATEEAENVLIEQNTSSIKFAPDSYREGSLQFSTITALDCQLSTANSVAQLDLLAIKFPLLLRKWKTGDYFYPLGMRKKKKLARFFIDQKLSKTDKEKVWVIESDKRIVWIVGHRIDDRFKITPKTERVFKINMSYHQIG